MRIRRMASLLFAGTLAAGLSTGVGASAQAATVASAAASSVTPALGAWYELFPPFISPSSLKCLDVPGASVKPYQAVQLFACHGYASDGADQRWKFWPNPDGSYQIQNVNSQLCLEAYSFDGEPVWQYYCDGYKDEEWWINPVYTNQFYLNSVAFPSECIAADNTSGADHTAITLRPCGPGSARTTWQLG